MRPTFLTPHFFLWSLWNFISQYLGWRFWQIKSEILQGIRMDNKQHSITIIRRSFLLCCLSRFGSSFLCSFFSQISFSFWSIWIIQTRQMFRNQLNNFFPRVSLQPLIFYCEFCLIWLISFRNNNLISFGSAIQTHTSRWINMIIMVI